ncbi:hypothetical protein H920_02905 [Fukomys damarensis]|uniref:Uncharacterized protein n=1 Tax=Fukomys damarensis TaxID=885580 RepID=A0A091EJJ5_FUKDA|nr:hypothetical protein H920_02905 [Fukomys damarensis]
MLLSQPLRKAAWCSVQGPGGCGVADVKVSVSVELTKRPVPSVSHWPDQNINPQTSRAFDSAGRGNGSLVTAAEEHRAFTLNAVRMGKARVRHKAGFPNRIKSYVGTTGSGGRREVQQAAPVPAGFSDSQLEQEPAS